MFTSTLALLASTAALALAQDGAGEGWYASYKYGNGFYSGPTKNGVYITKATYSLVVPEIPTTATNTGKNFLDFWIGTQNNPSGQDVLKENFVQPALTWAPLVRPSGVEVCLGHGS